jgi:hypothetical protein
VLVLIRPETLAVEAVTNGAVAEPNVFLGEVLTQTFLGPVTRVKVAGEGTSLIADMSTARAAALPVGARVLARVPAEGARLLSLPEDGEVPSALEPEDQ